jgi:uncharacterized Zn-finger protein
MVCNLCCPSAEALSSHLETDHLGSGKGSYTCHWEHCIRAQKPFSQRQKAIRHIRTHTGLKAYKVRSNKTPYTYLISSVKHVEKVSQHKKSYVNILDSIPKFDPTSVQSVTNDLLHLQHY